MKCKSFVDRFVSANCSMKRLALSGIVIMELIISGKQFNYWQRHQIFGILKHHSGASPGFGRGGGQEFFFSDLGICMSRSDMLRMAKPCALLGGFGGMLPRENFLRWCNLVRFGVYFDQILSLKNFKNYHFLYKNCNFLYKRINILDTRLLWGNNYSREEFF